MGEHLTARQALLLHVIAMVEESDVAVHRTGGGYIEVRTRRGMVFIEADGRVTEWHGDSTYQRWPTEPQLQQRLSQMFPSVSRRLYDAMPTKEADAPVR